MKEKSREDEDKHEQEGRDRDWHAGRSTCLISRSISRLDASNVTDLSIIDMLINQSKLEVSYGTFNQPQGRS